MNRTMKIQLSPEDILSFIFFLKYNTAKVLSGVIMQWLTTCNLIKSLDVTFKHDILLKK
jgi:hypothetical protein